MPEYWRLALPVEVVFLLKTLNISTKVWTQVPASFRRMTVEHVETDVHTDRFGQADVQSLTDS